MWRSYSIPYKKKAMTMLSGILTMLCGCRLKFYPAPSLALYTLIHILSPTLVGRMWLLLNSLERLYPAYTATGYGMGRDVLV